jgi:hypothetical protein
MGRLCGACFVCDTVGQYDMHDVVCFHTVLLSHGSPSITSVSQSESDTNTNHGININININTIEEAEFPYGEGIGNGCGFQLDNAKHTRIVVTATATKRRQ